MPFEGGVPEGKNREKWSGGHTKKNLESYMFDLKKYINLKTA